MRARIFGHADKRALKFNEIVNLVFSISFWTPHKFND